MLLLILFAFLAGVVTILSPCILPILPVVLSGSVGGSRKKPFGVIIGFVFSFTFFTLTLSTIVKATGIPADSFRTLSVFIIIFFGLSLLIPKFQEVVEKLFSRLSSLAPHSQKEGFWGGILIGLSLGLLWTPCVGPILASVISLVISGTVTGTSVLITLAYSIGTAIPMLIIVFTGRKLLSFIKNPAQIQKIFGLIMILTGIAIFFNIDRKFQGYILEVLPSYGSGLTGFEQNPLIQSQLKKVADTNLSAPELIPGGDWFNGNPLKLSELKGKVVLIDFWTYTCINCIRTLPYLKSWDAKYRDSGLVIIGIHTPEFEFEKNPLNVKKAILDLGLTYSIVQDNDYATWRAYNNQYWPAEYLIDRKGMIRYTHFGEGKYDVTEKKIQELLSEDGLQVDTPIANPSYELTSRTPELYFGTSRYRGGFITFAGNWTKSTDYQQAGIGSSLELEYSAKDVFLVARPKSGSAKIRVTLDNADEKIIDIDSDQAYPLYNLPVSGSHRLNIVIIEGEIEFYTFTFG